MPDENNDNTAADTADGKEKQQVVEVKTCKVIIYKDGIFQEKWTMMLK